ncbi:glutamate receptor [Chlorella sorokiniana]|uniref:Glutamate receptor n=1 Tax=Chlorella sorokiniana TaxID=3076 RepID=A0A2P6TZC9_CHLSO|nr:glutamate receptor [Chlorella sorokiniana]|eukprot:PRW59426.1 glutamate receptor [Chlorella sorokiniana]
MPSLGWEESMLDWRCMDRAELRAQLAANGSSSSGGGSSSSSNGGSGGGSGSGGSGSGPACDLLVAGLPMSTTQLAQGVSFTYPTSGDAYGLLVKAEKQPNDMWRFLDAFSWQLWVAIPLTCIAAGCIVWALDKAAFLGPHRAAALNEPKSPLAPATTSAGTLCEKVWEGLGRPAAIQVPLSRSVGGRLVWLTFAFMSMVLVTLYTSVTAATITVERLAPGIQSKVDLMGRRVGLSTFFNGTLPPRAIPIRYDSDGAMLEALLSREVDALMLPFSYLITSLIYDCRVEIASEPFSWFDRAIALPPGRRNDALIAAMNAALLELQTLGEDTGMSSRYWPSVEEEVCPYYNPSSHISLDQVSGLWVVLAGGVLLALLLASWPLVAAWRARRRHAAAQQADGEAVPVKGGTPLLPLSAAGSGKLGTAAEPPAKPTGAAQLPAAELPQGQQVAAGEPAEAAEQRLVAYCVDRVPLNYTGYQVEVFKAIMPALGWTKPMLNWSCMAWDNLLESLLVDNGGCDIAVAGMPVDSDLHRAGLTFSWPTVRATSMGYLSVIEARQFGMWSFFNPFTWQLWVAMWATAACVGLVVWATDLYSGWTSKCLAAAIGPQPEPAPRMLTSEQWRSEQPIAEQYAYASLGRFMRICVWKTRTDPARIVVFCYAFLQLTLALLYVANTTANVTAFTLKTAASDLSKLRSVGTWEALRGQVPEAGQAEIRYYPWNSIDDEAAMLNALKSGEVQALWMPETFLDYVAASDCSVAVVLDDLIPGLPAQLRVPGMFDVAFAFVRGFNNTPLLDKLNAAILALKESQLLDRLVDEELTRPSQCNRNSLPRQAAQLGFQQVAGLWVLLAIAHQVQGPMMVEAWQQAAGEPLAGGREADATEAAAEEEEQHLAALLEAQQAVERAVGMLRQLRQRRAPCPDWRELPQPVLTHILALLPRALEPMLVCKSWLAAALDCTSWWERCSLGVFLITSMLDSSGPVGEVIVAKRTPELAALLASPGGFESLLCGFQKRAAHCRELMIDKVLDAALVPRLLAAAREGSPRLTALDLQGAFERPEDVEGLLQAVATVQQLTRLQLAVQFEQQPAEQGGTRQAADWASLSPLSSLARLQSLELSLWTARADAAPDILGSLSQLTELSIHCPHTAGALPTVAWVKPDGGGPRLRRLNLTYCGMAAATATPDALSQLEQLQLTALSGCKALGDALPDLQRLSALSIETPPELAGQQLAAEQEAGMLLLAGAVACQPLQSLELGRFQFLFGVVDMRFPADRCLTQLTSLSLAYAFGPLLLPPSWCGLRVLERLVVTACPNYDATVPELPAEFSSLHTLKHLDLNGLDFDRLPLALAALQNLARLGVSLSALCDMEGLKSAAFLPGLRDLIVYEPAPVGQEEEEEEPSAFLLPGTLALATSLEQLDLGPCRSCLELDDLEDAPLLSSLPALRKLVLPCLPAAAGEEERGAGPTAAWLEWRQQVAARLRLELGAAGVEVEEGMNEGGASI